MADESNARFAEKAGGPDCAGRWIYVEQFPAGGTPEKVSVLAITTRVPDRRIVAPTFESRPLHQAISVFTEFVSSVAELDMRPAREHRCGWTGRDVEEK